MRQDINDVDDPFLNRNQRIWNLNFGNVIIMPQITIDATQDVENPRIFIGGNPIPQNNTQQQEQEAALQALRNTFNQQDIFQELHYNIILLQRLLENEIDLQKREQLKRVVQQLISKENIYNLSNQGKLTQIQIEIIETAIGNLLICVLKLPIVQAFNLLQFTQNLIQVLFSQFKIFNCYTMKNLRKIMEYLDLIKENYQHEQGLDILYEYQLQLMKEAINYQQDGNAKILEKFIFEQNKYQNQNELIFKLFQDANNLLQGNNNKEYDKYYFFQQLKLTIIRIKLTQQNINITQIVQQLQKGYQLCIQNNQNQRVHLGFLQILLELISIENQGRNDLIEFFNELSVRLINFQIQDNNNIWEYYINTNCASSIKCYLAFNLIILRNQQEQRTITTKCKELITLFSNRQQDENARMILQNEKVTAIQENFQQIQESFLQLKSYREPLKTHREKLQKEFQQNQVYINIPLKVSRKIKHNQQTFQQISDKPIYLFKEVASFDAEQEQTYEVNDFLWRDSNNSDLLLVYGMAGSGKSSFLKQLQLFLIKHYESSSKQKKWVPILIHLASFKEFNKDIWSQLLNAGGILLNNEQIKSFTDDIQNGQLNIVILFDGLDDIREKIYENFKMYIKKHCEKQLGKNVKIIITTRLESFISLEQIVQSYNLLTEIEIQNLDDSLIKEYLEQYCREILRQKIYSIQGQQQQVGIQFSEIWVAYFLQEVKALVKKTSTNQYILPDELFSSMQDKILSKFQAISKEQLSEFQNDFKKIQSTGELTKKINNNQSKNLIYVPQTLQLVLQLLSDIDKKVHKQKLQKLFKIALQKLKIEQITSIDQKEKASSQEYSESVQNLMNKLVEKKCFDNFSFENLGDAFSEVEQDLIKEAAIKTQFTYYQFYKLFISSYYEKQKKQKQNQENLTFSADFSKDLNKFQMLLAAQMIKNQSLELVKKEIENILTIYFNINNLHDPIGYQLIKFSLLKKLENDSYTFVNQSILEYFVGKYILRFIKDFSRDFKSRPIERDIESSQFNQDDFNLSLNQFQGVLNIINPELQNYKDIKQILIKILIQSRNEQFIRAGSNSILLINVLGFELIGEDLKGIKLSKTNLSGLNFFGSNLDQSVFKEVSMNYCNFNNTSLQRVQWTEIPWNNFVVSKGQNQEQIQNVEFSPDNQYLISQDRYSFKLWNLQTQKKYMIKTQVQIVKNIYFSSDSTKLLVNFFQFYQIYYIDKNDIRLLITIPQLFQESLSTFYHREHKLIFNQGQDWYTYNLENVIQSKSEWIKSSIFDKPTKFSCVKPMSNGEILIGYQDGEISMWDIQKLMIISKNDHQSAIKSLSEKTFQLNSDIQLQFQNNGYASLLISTSEGQVIVWRKTANRYEKVNALSSKNVNGLLPRFLNFSQEKTQLDWMQEIYLVFFRDEYIIFHDIRKIVELNDDIIMRDAYCMATQTWTLGWPLQPIKKHWLYVAKDNCIEIYDNYLIYKARIPLESCHPLSMYFCSNNYMISYNQDETIRFWYIQNENMGQSQTQDPNQYMTMDRFNYGHLIRGSIKGYVQNLRQSYKWKVRDQIIKIAAQENKQLINIYDVQLQKDRIEFSQGPGQRCSQDQTIGCFALFGEGEQIYLGINKRIEIRNLQNNQVIPLKEIHTQDIYQILFNEKESLLVSCSNDNSIVIWNTKDFNKNYCIKNLKCLDLVFESERQLIVQTENSITWYNIQLDLNVQVVRYIDSQESFVNNSLIQQMTVFQKNVRDYEDLNINDKEEQNLQYLAIKQGNNMILKHFQKGDQIKVVTFNEQDKNVEFASKHLIVYTIKSSNVLEVANIDDRKVIISLKFCQFAITERVQHWNTSYLIIVVETINEIIVRMIPNQQTQTLNKFESIQKQAKGIQTRLALSENGQFLAINNNQQIAIYLITQELKLIKMSNFSIGIEISEIYFLSTYRILIRSHDLLYQYSLNLEQTRIHSEKNRIDSLYNSIKLNYNEKSLAKISENHVGLISLQHQQGLPDLEGNFFTASLDHKYIAIYNDNHIDCYVWEEQIKFLYKITFQNKLYSLAYLKDPNQILAITSDNLIIYCKENQTRTVQGRYYRNTHASANEQIASIEQSTIRVSQTEYNNKLYYPKNFGYQARTPFFTQDGQYFVYQKKKKVIFQSLSNPNSKYIPEQIKGSTPISFLAESNYLVTLKKKESRISHWDKSSLKDEYYINVWDVTVLSNVKAFFEIPILKQQKKKMFHRNTYISEIDGNVLCIYDIKEIQKAVYDVNLYNYIENVHYAGQLPKGTKYYSVSKEDNSITIWSMKTKEIVKEFKDHNKNTPILFITFSEDEQYMISRDSHTIIVRNMYNDEKLIIEHFFQSHLEQNVYILYKCDFVSLENSLGITCQDHGFLHIYNLKDFKSYELYHTQDVTQKFLKSFRHYVFSNGTKIALQQQNQPQGVKISIFDVRTKHVINTLDMSDEQIFVTSTDSDEYFLRYLDQRNNLFQLYSSHSYIYSKEDNLLQVYNNQDLLKEDAKPIYEVFIHLHSNLDTTEQTMIQLNYVGRKYLTYYFNKQLRVIDLELYSKQVKLLKLDKSEKFLNYFSKDQILIEKKLDQFTTWNIYNLIDGSKKEMFSHDQNNFIAAFSNDGQYLAQGQNDGVIRIYKISTQKQEIVWQTYKPIKHLIYTKDDEILISASADNLVQFWNVQDKKKQKFIQSIQIAYDILSIVVSPNRLDVALELQGDLLQILTCNKKNSIDENKNSQSIGCYKTYPQLQQLMTENCILKNSIIEDQKKQSLINYFNGSIKEEQDSVIIIENQI
ncbi:unnamed protein product [Paramecium octaurelia]|uniref:NACHT domain-containing protein n=1 Tax=Paramecium octaurelia TaxID=43137 RepID=A0A8S1WQM1_PAROT|nr:unnamed protein product [Paramecium octaurelia]